MTTVMKTRALVIVSLLAACARFQPTTVATNYGPTGMAQSVTLKDTSVRYAPAVLRIGTPRSQVQAAFGAANASETGTGGRIEDVYAFNLDGTKFVDPQIRPRNLALAVFSMGASIAARQARLAIAERKLTFYHISYGFDGTIQSVREEKMSGAPESGTSGQRQEDRAVDHHSLWRLTCVAFVPRLADTRRRETVHPENVLNGRGSESIVLKPKFAIVAFSKGERTCHLWKVLQSLKSRHRQEASTGKGCERSESNAELTADFRFT
jgi:hypothetical protein